MKFNYLFDGQSVSKEAGIYEIHNVHSNRYYIGQTIRFEKRWNCHKSALLNGSRKVNKFLKNDFNHCLKLLGNDNFLIFSIVELLPNSTQIQRESREEEVRKEYIQKYGQDKVYSEKVIKKGERTVWSHMPEETRKRLSLAKKGKPSCRKGVKLSSETKKKISDAQKGKSISLKTRKKISISIKNNLPLTVFKKGQFSWMKGKTGLKNPFWKTYEGFQLFSPITKEIITKIECITLFSKNNDLNYTHLIQVLSGKRKSHKGWHLV